MLAKKSSPDSKGLKTSLKARRKLPILKIDRAPKARDKARLAAPLLVFRARGGGSGLTGGVGAKAGGARRRTILRFPHSSIFSVKLSKSPTSAFWSRRGLGKSKSDQKRGNLSQLTEQLTSQMIRQFGNCKSKRREDEDT